MAYVNACPKTKAEVNIAANRIGCRNGTNGRSSYMCIPNKEKTTLVEFCYNENIGIHEKGNCLEANLGRITEHNCLRFSYGCPDSDYFKDELYKFPACQHINTNSHCYVMDPLCQNETPIVESTDSGVVYACFTVCGIALLIIGAILLYLYREHRSRKGNRDKNKEDKEDELALLDIATVRNIVQDTEEKTQNTVEDVEDKEENDKNFGVIVDLHTTDWNIVQDTEEKSQNTVEDVEDKEENATDWNIVQDTEEKSQNTVEDVEDKEENDLATDRNIAQDIEEKTQNTVEDVKDKEENGGGQFSKDNVKMKRRHPFHNVKGNSETKK